MGSDGLMVSEIWEKFLGIRVQRVEMGWIWSLVEIHLVWEFR